MSVDENCQIDEFERVKEKRDGLLREVNDYKMKRDKIEKTLLKNDIALEATAWSVLDLERTVICPEAEESLMMKTNEKLLSCSSQTSTSGGRRTDIFLQHIPLVYLDLR